MPNCRRLLLDLGERAFDVAMSNAEIADIGDVHLLDLGPGRRVIAIDQHAARLADRGGPEPRPRPVRSAEIKRNAGDADCGVAARMLDAEKARPCGKSRYRTHVPHMGDAIPTLIPGLSATAAFRKTGSWQSHWAAARRNGRRVRVAGNPSAPRGRSQPSDECPSPASIGSCRRCALPLRASRGGPCRSHARAPAPGRTSV